MKYPYAKHKLSHKDSIAATKVLKSGILTRGKQTHRIEKKLCELTGAQFAVAVSSGTAALHCVYLALAHQKQKKNGGKLWEHQTNLITSPITFASSVTTAVLSGFDPIFCDVTKDSPQIDSKQLDAILKENQHKENVVLATAIAGHSYNQQEVFRVAKNFGAFIIADFAHSLGGFIADDQDVLPMTNLTYADVGILSFQATKVVTGGGEGGAILTNSEEMYQMLLAIRSHGMVYDSLEQRNMGFFYHEMQLPGLNYRITEMQAALIYSQLIRLDKLIEQRNIIAKWYYEALQSAVNIQLMPIIDPIPAWQLLVIRVKDRNTVAAKLRSKGIGTQVHYLPVYKHPWYQHNGFGKNATCPNAESYYDEALSIPMYVGLNKKDVASICKTILEITDSMNSTDSTHEN